MLVHARINGGSHELANLQFAPNASDADIRREVASRLDISVQTIARHVVDRGPSGDIVLRPEAVYG